MDNIKLIENKITSNDFKTALKLIEEVVESDKNFYQSLILKGEILITTKKWQEARDLANEELKMPYIPVGFEEKFIEIQKQANLGLQVKTGLKMIEPSVLEKALFREDDNSGVAAMILDLKFLNIENYIDVLSRFLAWEEGTNHLKSSILYLLKEMKYSKDLKVIKGNKEFLVNTLEVVNTNESKNFNFGIELLDKAFFQEASKLDIGSKMYFTKLYSITPEELSEEETKTLVEDIVNKVAEYFD